MNSAVSPAVSIVMPAYDAASFVAEALRSVLDQSVGDFEVIAIDDGSTDSTAAILDAHARADGRIRVLRQANGGTGLARNAGIDTARAGVIAFMDADDRWAPDLLARMTATLAAEPDLDLVFPRHRHVDARGQPTGIVSAPRQRRYSAHDLMIDNPIHSSTGCLIRRAACARAGRYDTAMPACIDIDYFARAVAGRGDAIGAVDRILADWRQHSGQITGNWRNLREGWEHMVAKAAAADHGLSCRDLRRARVRMGVYWATVAYNTADYAAARRLLAECLRHDPGVILRDAHARIRVAAVLASLLPDGMHRRLRDRFNGSATAATRID